MSKSTFVVYTNAQRLTKEGFDSAFVLFNDYLSLFSVQLNPESKPLFYSSVMAYPDNVLHDAILHIMRSWTADGCPTWAEVEAQCFKSCPERKFEVDFAKTIERRERIDRLTAEYESGKNPPTTKESLMERAKLRRLEAVGFYESAPSKNGQNEEGGK